MQLFFRLIYIPLFVPVFRILGQNILFQICLFQALSYLNLFAEYASHVWLNIGAALRILVIFGVI